jgi:hypothetical protein
MATCPRDGSALGKSEPGTPLGADALRCPKCNGTATSPMGARFFLSELGYAPSLFWPELVKTGAATLKDGGQLKCVRCANPCQLLVLNGVELDVCQACGSAWFDGGEVQRLVKGYAPVAAPAAQGHTPGTTGVVGVFEMLWDCAFCDTKALLGKTNRFCPSCGAPQDPKKRYFPEDGKEVAANTTFDGADLTCPACQTPNGAKANNCRHCGSPLNEAAKVGLVKSQGVPQAPPAGQAPVTKSSSKLPYIIGGVAVALIGFCVVTMMWTKDVTATVSGHSWERSIDIEEKRAKSDSSWCDSLPSGAYAVSRKQEQRSTKKVGDGQECHNEKHDRGDGTFEKREVCKPKYREEPVYDDKCYFTVDRWEHERSVKANGGLNDEPSWPRFSLTRECNALGCEREGTHHESYTVKLTSNEKKSYDCDKPQAQWKQLTEGKSYPIKVRMIGGGADCESLKP